jgi:hypothetical protein
MNEPSRKESKQEGKGARLVVPLDARGVDGFSPDQSVKVLARYAGGRTVSAEASFDDAGTGEAKLTFPEVPGPVSLMVGPGDASDDELQALRTLRQEIPRRLWEGRELTVPAIPVPEYWWSWWPRWCRTFSVRGRVVCADGSPVPGAEVCAFDIDTWLFWTSRQQVGCAVTDIDGTFSLSFRWCCGWYPWWWLRRRHWRRRPDVLERWRHLLEELPELDALQGPDPVPPLPSLVPLEGVLAEGGVRVEGELDAARLGRLEEVRGTLLERLPRPREPELLRLWPWSPWHPWSDCAPDLVFRVTQDCVTPGQVIVDEGPSATRWNVPTEVDVTLVASDDACCRSVPCPQPPCPEGGECITTGRVCRIPVAEVGGNLSAPAAPAGFLYPGAVAAGSTGYNGDRPFARGVSLYRTPGELLDVDVYELEMDSGSGWIPVPETALPTFHRYWLRVDGGVWTSGSLPFVWDAVSHPGHTVVKTVEYAESTGPYSDWAPQPAGSPVRFWNGDLTHIGTLDSEALPDGTHRFRVVGWEVSGGALTNRRVLPVCGGDDDNEVVLSFSNAGAAPAVELLAVRIDGQPVDTCGTTDRSGLLEVDFRVEDPAGFLAYYTLNALYGSSSRVNLLDRPSAALTALSGVEGWSLGDPRGSYGRALAQGAAAPVWGGGRFRLTVPVAEAFPVPCCYLLDLWGHKRNVVGCSTTYAWRARDFFTVGVGVCDPVVPPPVPPFTEDSGPGVPVGPGPRTTTVGRGGGGVAAPRAG